MAYNFEYPYTDPGYGNDDWLINTVKQLIEDWKTVYKDWESAKDYIDNYFKNLDVSAEIADKIQDLIDDGTIENIINQQIFEELNDKVDSHITESNQKFSNIDNSINSIESKVTNNTNSINSLKTNVNLNKEEIENKIDAINNNKAGWTSFDHLWQIMEVDNIISMGNTYTHTAVQDTDYTSARVSTSNTRVLDMPIESSSVGISGSCGSGLFTPVNMYIENNTLLKFRLFSMSSSPTWSNLLTKLNVIGKKALPPNSASNAYNSTKASQLLEVADTYLNAVVNGRKFAYGYNWLYSKGNKAGKSVNNENGEGLCECDTFVWLCIAGIKYEDSPYALVTSPEGVYNRSDITINTDYTWTVRDLKSNQYEGFISDGSTMNWYLFNHSWVFNPRDNNQFLEDGETLNPNFGKIDWSLVHDGDIVLLHDKSKNSFDNFGHIGLVRKKGDDWYIIHCSGSVTTDDKIIAEIEFYRYLELRNLYKEENIYFARIKY